MIAQLKSEAISSSTMTPRTTQPEVRNMETRLKPPACEAVPAAAKRTEAHGGNTTGWRGCGRPQIQSVAGGIASTTPGAAVGTLLRGRGAGACCNWASAGRGRDQEQQKGQPGAWSCELNLMDAREAGAAGLKEHGKTFNLGRTRASSRSNPKSNHRPVKSLQN